MNKKLFIHLSVVFFFYFTNASFSQIKSERVSFGYSLGYVNNIHLDYSVADHFQFGLLIGDIVIDKDINFHNLGASFKYFLNDNDISPYLGFSASTIIGETLDYYFYFPLGVQKFATNDSAFSLGFNPGIYINDDINYLMTAEIGIAFYF